MALAVLPVVSMGAYWNEEVLAPMRAWRHLRSVDTNYSNWPNAPFGTCLTRFVTPPFPVL